MTAPRFRVGDVVHAIGQSPGRERVVTYASDTIIRTGADGHFCVGELTLLRRPCLPGDVLVHPLNPSVYREVFGQGDVVCQGPREWARCGWTHESGCAIDIPTAPAPAVATEPVRYAGSIWCAVGATHHLGNGRVVVHRDDPRLTEQRQRDDEQRRACPTEPAPSLDGLQLEGEHGPIRVIASPMMSHWAPNPRGLQQWVTSDAELTSAVMPELADEPRGLQQWMTHSWRASHETGPLSKSALPSEVGLARALFATDPEVVAWVDLRAEVAASCPAADEEARVRDIAWTRSEPAGARPRAEERAAAVLAALRGGDR